MSDLVAFVILLIVLAMEKGGPEKYAGGSDE